MAAGIDNPTEPEWVDEVLLAGPADQVCLVLDAPVDRATLRALVAERRQVLHDAGLRAGGSVAVCLPPSLAFITNLLAIWRIGGRAALLDHRLTAFEVEQAIERLAPQFVVGVQKSSGGALRAFQDVQEKVVARASGQPSDTSHALIQLSSGSTGPSKAIGRTASDLIAEIERYKAIGAGVPAPGERIVSLASMVHVLGLVGGLLYGLHAGVQLVLPGRMTADAILDAVAAGPEPTTLLGVPFHIELLAAVAEPPRLPQLTGMTTGGELVRAQVHDAFADRYGIRLGNMYGMTELGVIATDLFGTHRPAVLPAPGIQIRADDGELHIAMENSPYVGLVDPTRWSDGWLHTKDAGSVEEATGLVRVRGRRDSQVSIGGLKVDLSEVEHTLAGLPGVEAAVVVYGKAIEAYVVLAPAAELSAVQDALTERVAAYKRPRAWHAVEQLPRTATGKLVRDQSVLSGAR